MLYMTYSTDSSGAPSSFNYSRDRAEVEDSAQKMSELLGVPQVVYECRPVIIAKPSETAIKERRQRLGT